MTFITVVLLCVKFSLGILILVLILPGNNGEGKISCFKAYVARFGKAQLAAKFDTENGFGKPFAQQVEPNFVNDEGFTGQVELIKQM